MTNGVELSKIGYDLKGFEIYSESDFSVSITDGSINFKPDLDIDIDIDDFKLKEFHAIASGDLDFTFDVTLTAANKSHFKYEKSLFAVPPRKVLIQWIGWVPIVEVIKFDLRVGIEIDGNSAGGIMTGLDHDTHIKVGAQYSSGDWSPIWEKEVKINVHETSWKGEAGIEIKAYVRPVVSVEFYAIAGPNIDVVPYLGFNGDVGGSEYLWQYEIVGGVVEPRIRCVHY